MGYGHILFEVTHSVHLVRVNHMDNSTCAKEEQAFEHCVSEEVEHGSHVADTFVQFGASHTERGEHESNLRDCRESEHALDVGLRASHNGGVEGGNGTCDGDEFEHLGSEEIHREHARHQVNTGNDHRSGVDKSRNGRRAFHSVGEPDVQGEHSRLAGATDEDERQSPRSSRAT